MMLTQEQLTILEDAASDSLLELRTDYSGRGMYGKTCVGVTGGMSAYTKFILIVAEQDYDLANKLPDVATDSMGLDRIFYWPGLQAE